MNARTFRSLVKSTLITFGICAALLFLATFLAYRMKDPAAYTAPAAYSVLFAGSALTGFLAAKFNGERCLMTGLLAGAVYAGITLFVGMLFGGIRNMLIALLICAGLTVAAGLTGLLGRPHEPSPEKLRSQARKKYLTRAP